MPETRSLHLLPRASILLLVLLLAACGPGQSTLPPEPTPSAAIGPGSLAAALNPDDLRKDARGCFLAPAQYQQWIANEMGFCLLYPAFFRLEPGQDNAQWRLLGPQHTGTGQAVQAALAIQSAPAGETALESALQAAIALYPQEDILHTPVTVEGFPAEIVDNLVGEFGVRVLVVIAHDRSYTFTLTPAGEQFPEAGMEADLLWSTVLASLHFLDPAQASAGGAETAGWSVESYADLGMNFLLPPRWQAYPIPGGYNFTPGGSAAAPGIILRALDQLPANDPAALTAALAAQFQEQGVSGLEFSAYPFAGVEGVRVNGLSEQCLNVVLPVQGLARQVIVHSRLCSADGQLASPEAQGILDSLEFFEAVQ
ncbi:MAG: hypothetical protein L0Z70_11215 [Chloroflexi bacterium]|nr:hypothetical protein [Chloroflexota bacterium]